MAAATNLRRICSTGNHASWTPQRIQGWANTLGPEVSAWVRYQFENKAHPEQARPGLSGAAVAGRASMQLTRVEKACHMPTASGLPQSDDSAE